MNGIAVSHGNLFNLLRNCCTVFQSGCTILHFYPKSVSIPISLHARQHLSLPVFLIIAILVDVKWYLIVVLICILLMTNNVEALFMCLLSICVSSLKNCLFNFLPIFKLDCLFIIEL